MIWTRFGGQVEEVIGMFNDQAHVRARVFYDDTEETVVGDYDWRTWSAEGGIDEIEKAVFAEGMTDLQDDYLEGPPS